MNYIVIDTTKKIAHILGKIQGVEYKTYIGVDQKHSENLLPAIDKILNMADAKFQDVQCFGVVTGPGSFTGIRVGLATLKAFCYGRENSVIAFTSFDVLKNVVKNGSILMTSTSTTYYEGEIKNGNVISAKVIEKTNLSKPYFGLEEEKDSLPEDCELIANFDQLVFHYMDQKIKDKSFDDIIKIEPYYLQLSQAERELEKKRG